MNCIIRPIISKDKLFLWEMLYQALHVPEGQSAPPREVIRLPELARYSGSVDSFAYSNSNEQTNCEYLVE